MVYFIMTSIVYVIVAGMTGKFFELYMNDSDDRDLYVFAGFFWPISLPVVAGMYTMDCVLSLKKERALLREKKEKEHSAIIEEIDHMLEEG